jgi:hypothetical protein
MNSETHRQTDRQTDKHTKTRDTTEHNSTARARLLFWD